jgi:hypothetical protein
VAALLQRLPEAARVRYTEVGERYDEVLAKLAGRAEFHRRRAEEAGLWQDLKTLAIADDPMAIAAGFLRVVQGMAQPGSLRDG